MQDLRLCFNTLPLPIRAHADGSRGCHRSKPVLLSVLFALPSSSFKHLGIEARCRDTVGDAQRLRGCGRARSDMQLQALTSAPSVGMFPGTSSSRPAAMPSVVGHDDRRSLPTCVISALNFKREDLSGMTCGQQTCSLGAASQHTVLLHDPAVPFLQDLASAATC
jgi:hypothetical protein